MNMKTFFTVTAMAATMALAGCSSHHAHRHHQSEPASFKAYMKANDAANTSNMMAITPIKLPERHK
ncbi:hypothetical protein BBC27_12070 [Acidithiobacillus ferrivorans]|uniref:Lipoprotein n=1 Tax=Acidithiobacillus ferrivorans TaxID=160808 RepID=A0A1B9BYD0_9PROT|nr:hypothetical protein [Acidithiobacillus ferrivorans]OCB02653.1 hypothetical protein BBC27_12070 [Acidithiobacillus ferrivorans]